MNREIKFRAWAKKEKAMLRNCGILTGPSVAWISQCDAGTAINPSSDKFKLMQYTGLKDKNGVGIYEWDLVKYGTDTIPYTVSWVNGGFILSATAHEAAPDGNHMLLGKYNMAVIEVIGNIYENPEFLQKGDV